MDTLDLTLGMICLGLTIFGFLKDQGSLLIMAGIGWLALGLLLGDAATDPAIGLAVGSVGVGMSLVCFIQPLVAWQRKRVGRLSPEDQDYEEHRRKIEDITRRR